jgi:hypothetical protein
MVDMVDVLCCGGATGSVATIEGRAATTGVWSFCIHVMVHGPDLSHPLSDVSIDDFVQ